MYFNITTQLCDESLRTRSLSFLLKFLESLRYVFVHNSSFEIFRIYWYDTCCVIQIWMLAIVTCFIVSLPKCSLMLRQSPKTKFVFSTFNMIYLLPQVFLFYRCIYDGRITEFSYPNGFPPNTFASTLMENSILYAGTHELDNEMIPSWRLLLICSFGYDTFISASRIENKLCSYC